jgi:hypothetical protein
VNNTDALIVLNHINNNPPLPINPPVMRVTADVSAPHPAIDNTDYTNIRQAAKFGWGFFDIPKWVFSGETAATRIDTFALACNNMTRNIRGLCAGDVNGSYSPVSGYKTMSPGLELVHEGELPLGEEMVFPVRLKGSGSTSLNGSTRDLGAITLFLNYDPAMIEITGFSMPDDGGVPPVFDTREGVLYIGWMSTDAIHIEENQPVIFIRTRLVHPFETTGSMLQPSQTIGFSLNENPLSELADGNADVMDGARLSVTDVRGHEAGLQVVVYPNPAFDKVNVEFNVVRDASVRIILTNLQGEEVMRLNMVYPHSGWQHEQINAGSMPPGIYFVKVATEVCTETIKLVKIR